MTDHWMLGVVAAALVGFSKAGVPGMGILVVPLMAMVFPAKTSVGALLPMLITGDVLAVALYKRHAQWNRLWNLFPWVLVGTVPGAWALRRFGNAELEPALGWLVLSLVALEIARQRLGWDRIPHHWAFAGAVGIIAGFSTTLGNVAGPIMTVYFLSKGLNKDEFLGSSAWFFFIVNLTKLPIFAGLGMITGETLRFDAWMLPCVVVGAVTGYSAQSRIPQKAFNTLVLALAALAALHLVLR